MRQQRSGVLIHVSSGAGRVVVPTMAAYSASKFALEAIADAYRYELLPFGIDSVLIEPGIYRTPIFDRVVRPGMMSASPNTAAPLSTPNESSGCFTAPSPRLTIRGAMKWPRRS